MQTPYSTNQTVALKVSKGQDLVIMVLVTRDFPLDAKSPGNEVGHFIPII